MYSQFDEDGIINEIFCRIGLSSRVFLEFGVGNGVENNTLALLIAGWTGGWIEASTEQAQVAQAIFVDMLNEQKLKILNEFVYRDNIENLIIELFGSAADVDLLSIDIDGNDYWIWEAIQSISPRVVVIEYNATWRPNISVTTDYAHDNNWRGNNHFGVSLKALEVLGRRKGYSLVGCSLAGANAFFVRNDVCGEHFLEPYTAEEHYEPARYYLFAHAGHPPGYGRLVNVPTDTETSTPAPPLQAVRIELAGLKPFRLVTHNDNDLYISSSIRKWKVWEPFETDVLRTLLQGAHSFVDLGANIGWYTVIAGLQLGEQGRVFSFEPDPENFSLLSLNASLNSLTNITLVNGAMSDTSGNAVLYKSVDNQGDHRLYDAGQPRTGIATSTVTFDEFFVDLERGVNLIKIDTQGSEILIFRGMKGYLQRFAEQTALIIEFWPYGLQNAGGSAEELLQLLGPFGYEMFDLDEYGSRLTRISSDMLRERVASDLCVENQKNTNLVLIHPSHGAFDVFVAKVTK
jgi:FkbM family methyltransferase